jgi:hypothetical protein
MIPPVPDPARRPASPALPGISPKEKLTVFVMAASLLAVSGWLAYQWATSSPAATTPDGKAPRPLVTDGTGPGGAPAPDIEFAPAPLFPEEEAREVELGLQEKLRHFRGISDGVLEFDEEPYRMLLEETVGNFRVVNLRPQGFEPMGPLLPYQEKPSEHRGRLLTVSGDLVSLDRIPMENTEGLVKEVRRGVIRTTAGEWVTFSWAVTNPLIPDEVRPGDGWARLQGVFLKGWNTPVGESAAPVFTAHLVLTSPPEKDYPPVTVTDIDSAWFGQVKDTTPAEAMVRDYPPFFLLLNMVERFGTDGFERWAKERQATNPALPVWPPEDFTDRSRELMQNSVHQRFRTVSYTGYLKQPRWVYDLKPNPGNVKNLWLAFVVSSDFVPVWVYSPKSFVDLGFKDGERVHLQGFFLQRVTYLPRGGREMLQAPVLVMARLQHAPMSDSSVGWDIVYVVGGIALILAIALCAVLLQGRREDAVSVARRVAKAKERRERAAEEDATSVGAPTPREPGPSP